MTDYLTVPGTAKNPSALKKFKTAEVAKVRSTKSGGSRARLAILSQPNTSQLTFVLA